MSDRKSISPAVKAGLIVALAFGTYILAPASMPEDARRMALPVSTPPNAIAFSSNMIKSKDMMVSGLIVSAVSLFLVLMMFKFILVPIYGMK